MEDPKVENIAGAKTHQVMHEVNWGIVVGSVTLLLVILYLDPLNRFRNEPAVG